MNFKGTYFWFDKKLCPSDTDQLSDFTNLSDTVYEVVRYTDGVALFFEDHFIRLQHSMERRKIVQPPDKTTIQQIIDELGAANHITEGNIRIDISLPEAKIRVAFIPHSYPTKVMYQQGVKLVSVHAHRDMPDVKQESVRQLIKNEVDNAIARSGSYEAVLIEPDGSITEGSRSNLFFIRRNVLYTAPDSMVLKGITRQKMLDLAHQESIKVQQSSISIDELPGIEAAFLTGTSPKLLPISKIDTCSFQINHPVITLLMDGYNRMIRQYIDSKKA